MPTDQSQLEIAEENTESPSRTIIHRISEVTDQNISQLPPLYETIDPDALDNLLNSIEGNDTFVSIEFTYAGEQISIDTDGLLVTVSSN
jgi:hypothetical protein